MEEDEEDFKYICLPSPPKKDNSMLRQLLQRPYNQPIKQKTQQQSSPSVNKQQQPNSKNKLVPVANSAYPRGDLDPKTFEEAFLKSLDQQKLGQWKKGSYTKMTPLEKRKLRMCDVELTVKKPKRRNRGKQKISSGCKNDNEKVEEIKTEMEFDDSCAPFMKEENGTNSEDWATVVVEEDLETEKEEVAEGECSRLTQLETNQIPSKYFDCICCFTYTKDSSSPPVLYKNYTRWYKCPKCSFETDSTYLLQKHKKSLHNAPISWILCSFCTFTAKNSSEFHQHVAVHAETFKIGCLRCDLCDHEAETWLDIEKHFAEKHGETNFLQIMCGICPHQNRSVNALKTHLFSCHPWTQKPDKYKVVNYQITVPTPESFCIYEVEAGGVRKTKCAFCNFISEDKTQVWVHIESNHSLIKVG